MPAEEPGMMGKQHGLDERHGDEQGRGKIYGLRLPLPLVITVFDPDNQTNTEFKPRVFVGIAFFPEVSDRLRGAGASHMAPTRRSLEPMTLVWGLIFLIVGLTIGAVAAWITTRAEVRVAREELSAERAERRTEATAGIGRIAADLSSHLEIVKKQIGDLEKQRAAGDASLRTTLQGLQSSDQELRTALVSATSETARLTTALRDNRVRGRWGELSLRRIVELSGMVEHCDFSEQKTVDGKRPDAIVHLPDNMTIPIDAKAPLEDYYKALEANDPAETKRLLEANAGALRAKVREVARRDYPPRATRASRSSYIPLESVLSAALSVDP